MEYWQKTLLGLPYSDLSNNIIQSFNNISITSMPTHQLNVSGVKFILLPRLFCTPFSDTKLTWWIHWLANTDIGSRVQKQLIAFTYQRESKWGFRWQQGRCFHEAATSSRGIPSPDERRCCHDSPTFIIAYTTLQHLAAPWDVPAICSMSSFREKAMLGRRCAALALNRDTSRHGWGHRAAGGTHETWNLASGLGTEGTTLDT